MDTNILLIIAIIVVVVIFRLIVPVMRRSDAGSHVPGQYSLAGGAVCSRCDLPYSRKTFSPNLLVDKLERCPHCGKIAVVRRASAAALEVAEVRFAAGSQADAPHPEKSQAESLGRHLDDSRFEN